MTIASNMGQLPRLEIFIVYRRLILPCRFNIERRQIGLFSSLPEQRHGSIQPDGNARHGRKRAKLCPFVQSTQIMLTVPARIRFMHFACTDSSVSLALLRLKLVKFSYDESSSVSSVGVWRSTDER